MRRAALKPHAPFHYTVQEIVLFLLVQSFHIVDDGRGVIGRSGSRCVVVFFFLFVALTSLAFRPGLNHSRPLCPPPRPSAPFAAAAAATILDWTILCLVTLAAVLEGPALIQPLLAFFLAQTSANLSSASGLLFSERDHVDVHGIWVSLRLPTLWLSRGSHRRFWRVLRKSPPSGPRLANTILRCWTLRRAAARHLSMVVGIGSRWRIVQCEPFRRPCLSISNDPLAFLSQPALSRRATYGLIFFPIVDHIIAQDPLKRSINTMRPGAYVPITRVDFKVQDNFIIRLVGIHGSKVEIVRFVVSSYSNAVGEDLCVIFFIFFAFRNLTITSAVVVCYFCQLSLAVPGHPYRLTYTSSLLERRVLLRNTIMSYIGLRTQLGTTRQLLQFVGTVTFMR